jgi:hypothetical protein
MFITSSIFEVNRNDAPRCVENSIECRLFTGPCHKEGADREFDCHGSVAMAKFFQGFFPQLGARTHRSLSHVCENRGQVAVGEAVRAMVQEATRRG